MSSMRDPEDWRRTNLFTGFSVATNRAIPSWDIDQPPGSLTRWAERARARLSRALVMPLGALGVLVAAGVVEEYLPARGGLVGEGLLIYLGVALVVMLVALRAREEDARSSRDCGTGNHCGGAYWGGSDGADSGDDSGGGGSSWDDSGGGGSWWGDSGGDGAGDWGD